MESLEGTAYTIKEINAMNNCHVFTVAAFCSLKQLTEVQEVWKTVFTNVDTLYCIDKTSSEGIFNVLYITQMLHSQMHWYMTQIYYAKNYNSTVVQLLTIFKYKVSVYVSTTQLYA